MYLWTGGKRKTNTKCNLNIYYTYTYKFITFISCFQLFHMNTVKMLLIFHDVALRGRCTARMNEPVIYAHCVLSPDMLCSCRLTWRV